MRNLNFDLGIVTFNRYHYLKQIVNSVFAQTYSNYTLTIYDNCSNDATREYCRELENQRRIRYLPTERNIGSFANFSRAYRDVRGDIKVVLHDDDILRQDFLELVAARFNDADDSVVAVATNADFIDEKNNIIKENALHLSEDLTFKKGVYIRHFLQTGENLVNYPSLSIRSQYLSKVHPVRRAGPGGDVEFNRQLNELGSIGIVAARPFLYRIHSAQDSRMGRAYRVEWLLSIFYLQKATLFPDNILFFIRIFRLTTRKLLDKILARDS